MHMLFSLLSILNVVALAGWAAVAGLTAALPEPSAELLQLALVRGASERETPTCLTRKHTSHVANSRFVHSASPQTPMFPDQLTQLSSEC